ncbi:MAG: transglycosylase SLT domain-containing protein [Pseudobdellovibrio sp.]
MRTKSVGLSILIVFSSFVIFVTNGCHGVYMNETKASSFVAVTPIKVGLHKHKSGRTLEETLIKAFASDYNLKLIFLPYTKYTDLIEDFNQDKFDIILTKSSARHVDLSSLQGPSYEDNHLSLFCRNQNISEILIPKQFEFIRDELIDTKPDLTDKIVIKDQTFDQILHDSYQRRNSCFVAESQSYNFANVEQKKYVRIWSSTDLYPQSWFINKNNNELHQLVNVWFQKMIRENKMIRFQDQFDAPSFKMSLLTYRSFKKDVVKKLPLWRNHFIDFAKKYDVPWTLIAAVAYQESKWESDARSYTGVRGFMQITSKTAEHLGIEDREDPIQSIQGGALYLQKLYDKTPIKLTRFERWIQALAAYNMGWSHLRDLHRLARESSIDLYRWKNLKEFLPEKSNEENLDDFQFGLARGEETINFIEGVLSYHEALNNMFTQQLQTSRDF